MASVEGVMLGGYILSETQFKEVFTLLLKEKKEELIIAINNVLISIDKKDYYSTYSNWQKIQTEIFKNKETTLLAILNLTAKAESGKQEWVHISDEANALYQSKATINIQKAKKVTASIREQINSVTLAKHLSDLFKSVTTDKVTWDDESLYLIRDFTGYQNKAIRNRLENQINHVNDNAKNYTYLKIIYGADSTFGRGRFRERGMIADAFLNHLGNIHSSFFSGDEEQIFNRISESLGSGQMTTVKEEENSASAKFGFLHLLLNSLNVTRWYSGGDLIITNAKSQVIANIQLKTSITEGAQIGNLAIADLNKDLNELLKSLKTDDADVANKFYETLKTSAIIGDFGDNVIKIGKVATEDVLKALKLNVDFTL